MNLENIFWLIMGISVGIFLVAILILFLADDIAIDCIRYCNIYSNNTCKFPYYFYSIDNHSNKEIELLNKFFNENEKK